MILLSIILQLLIVLRQNDLGHESRNDFSGDVLLLVLTDELLTSKAGRRKFLSANQTPLKAVWFHVNSVRGRRRWLI